MESAVELEARRRDAYRALGRYVAEFSRLTFRMRVAMEGRLSGPGESGAAMQLVFGEAAAATLARTFFALCKMFGNLDEGEEQIRARLFDLVVHKKIPERNAMVHGDWWIGTIAVGQPDPLAAHMTRADPRRAESTKTIPMPANEIERKATEIGELRNIVCEFGAVCFGTHPFLVFGEPNLRASDLFVLDGPRGKKTVRREGPKAHAKVTGHGLTDFPAEFFANYP